MTDTADTMFAPQTPRVYAAWATKPRRRGLGLTAMMTGAIIRIRPLALLNLALLMCALSGASMVLLAVHISTTQAAPAVIGRF
jgi:hypothetical protein